MNNKDMEIRTTEEIQEWKQQPIESDNGLNWVRTSQIKERINHIRDVIRECSFEDDFGEQCFKYCDLNNMFKILETELNKPKVNGCSPLDDKQEGGRHSSH